METWAVVVAGGTGSRFGSPKQFAEIEGRSLLDWSMLPAREVCAGVVLVLPASELEMRRWAADRVVAGGSTRSESVRAGLAALPATATVVAVHDAARPLARVELWRAVIGAVEAGADGAVPACPVTDTVKQIQPEGGLVTLDRATLVAVQTPQAFDLDKLREAHRSGADATDDAALVEAIGGKVVLVDGQTDNLKVTTPSDLLVAAALIKERR